jgi:hypothetical protein
MLKKILIFIFSLFIIPSPYFSLAQNKSNEKKLIEFGWDYPNVSSLKANISRMEKTPFDGVVFSFDFDIYNAFDTTQQEDSKFQYNDLSKIQWKKFTDNFLFVRGASYSGAHWLDDKDWIKISQNLKKVSKALAISKAKGIAFDPEYYFKDSTLNPWVYRPSWYNYLSYQEVGDYVRKRGEQFIQALQTYKPDVKLFCFWLLGLAEMQHRSRPIAETGMALYPFFVEGMLAGKNKSSEIIDGDESSYWYQKPENFIESGEFQRKNGSQLIKRSLQTEFNKVSLAKAVYFDGLYAKSPGFDKGFDKQTKERRLRDNLYFAYKSTDKYVWFYNEKINWWKNQVDSGVTDIINEVRDRINVEQNNRNPQIKGESLIFDFKKISPDNNYQGFGYNYIVSRNMLEINFLKKDIINLRVYQNSRLIYNIENPEMRFKVDLTQIYNKEGDLILISTDSKGIRSVAYVN